MSQVIRAFTGTETHSLGTNGAGLFTQIKAANNKEFVPIISKDGQKLNVHLVRANDNTLFYQSDMGYALSIELDKLDIQKTLRAVKMEGHPLFNVLSSAVKVRNPNIVERSARLSSDGYEIVSGLPVLTDLSEKDLYKKLSQTFRNTQLTIARTPDGTWYNRVGAKRKKDGNPDGVILVLKKIALPPAFEKYLEARWRYLAERFSGVLNERIDFAEVRIGQALGQEFHYDSGLGAMVKALNRDGPGEGTYFSAPKSDVAFENPPGDAILFAAESGALGPPALHAAPPKGGNRIFIRYGITNKKIDPSVEFEIVDEDK